MRWVCRAIAAICCCAVGTSGLVVQTRGSSVSGRKCPAWGTPAVPRGSSQAAAPRGSRLRCSAALDEAQFLERKDELKKVLRREYESFFAPFERDFYNPEVEFIDPTTSFRGFQRYENNLNLLAGRSIPGAVLFKDARIKLHSITEPGPANRLRWTLSMCFKALPWQPVARFTGVSEYVLDGQARVLQQKDFWDSINLDKGVYKAVPPWEGIKDFAGQLKPGGSTDKQAGLPDLAGTDGADMVAEEGQVPYRLLRRAKDYQVRLYPACKVAETSYSTRPEAYECLDSFLQGLPPLRPSLTYVPSSPADGSGAEESKIMQWPLSFLCADGKWVGATSPAGGDSAAPGVSLKELPPALVAVRTFDQPSTAEFVRDNSRLLWESVLADCLVPVEEGAQASSLIVAQFSPVYSLGPRDNEVWLPLAEHDWPELA